MAYSYTDSGPKGPGDTLTVGFPFESRDHVSVLVDGVLVAGSKWSWVSDGLISCLAGFPTGALTRVKRTTPDNGMVGELVGTASFDYPMVNSNFDRALYILQEKADAEADREARVVALENELDSQQADLDASVLLGQRWANEAENTVVAGGEYSSKHYSLKSKAEKDAAISAKDASVSARDASVSAKTASEAARDLSQKWASEPEDSVVSGGLFSAFHWYRKTLALYTAVANGLAGWIHGATSKTTPADADELGVSDSAASWGLKKFTWANIKAAIGVQQDGRLGDHIPGGTVLDADLMVGSGWYFYNSTNCVNGPLPNVPAGAGNGYIQAYKQALTAPSNVANKQVFYEAQGHRTFTRWRWYTSGWGAWVETTVLGRQTKFIPATDWQPDLVVGPSVSVSRQVTSGLVYTSLDFDSATTEWAYFTWTPDKKWNLGQLRFDVIWYGASAGAGGVMFQLAGVAIGNADTIDPGLTNAATSGSGYTGSNQLQATGLSAVFTPSGPPAAGDVVMLRLGRIVADVNDTLAQDAKVIGVRLYWDAAAGNDA